MTNSQQPAELIRALRLRERNVTSEYLERVIANYERKVRQ